MPVDFNERSNDRNNRPPERRPFYVSNSSFGWANALGGAGSIVFLLIYTFNQKIGVEQGDIQTLAEVVLGAGSIALAIPLFLNDLQQDNLFWKQFFLTGFVFILAGLLSFFALTKMTGAMIIDVRIYFAFPLVAILSHAVPSISWITAGRPRRRFTISIQVGLTFFVSMIALGLCLITSEGDRLLGLFLLLTFFGFYLMLVVCLAILFQFFDSHERLSPREEIKRAIEAVSEKHKERELEIDEVVRLVRREHFNERQEIVNKKIVEELVDEMSYETGDGAKITRNYGTIYPRWKAEYQQLLDNAEPRMIVAFDDYRIRSLKELYKNTEDIVIDELAENSRLSTQLINDGGFNLTSRYAGNYSDDTKRLFIACEQKLFDELSVYQQWEHIDDLHRLYRLFGAHAFCTANKDIGAAVFAYAKIEKVLAPELDVENLIPLLKSFEGAKDYQLVEVFFDKLFRGANEELVPALKSEIRKQINVYLTELEHLGWVYSEGGNRVFDSGKWYVVEENENEGDEEGDD